MVNVLTIEAAYALDPYKDYFVIQNPRIDSKKKKVVGKSIKTVKYRVKDWDTKEIRFEKIDITKNKRFPEIINFDKRYPDAENEVYAERVSKAKKKPDVYDSFGIFIDPKSAEYHKLIRLHRLAEDMAGIYKAMKEQGSKKIENEEQKDKDIEKGAVITKAAEKDIKEGMTNTDKLSFQLDEVKSYFETIQDTGYFERLEKIQEENPSLATK